MFTSETNVLQPPPPTSGSIRFTLSDVACLSISAVFMSLGFLHFQLNFCLLLKAFLVILPLDFELFCLRSQLSVDSLVVEASLH